MRGNSESAKDKKAKRSVRRKKTERIPEKRSQEK
jgi:hypothetical protein